MIHLQHVRWLRNALQRSRELRQLERWKAEGRVVHPVSGLNLERYFKEYRDDHSKSVMRAARAWAKFERDRRAATKESWRLVYEAETERVSEPTGYRSRLRKLHREERGFCALPR